MDVTADTAAIAAQIITMLLVATILEPWTKGKGIANAVGAIAFYLAKVVTILVLLFNMQIVLFGNTVSGTAGLVLALGNYAAVTACGMSILLSFMSHQGWIKRRSAKQEP